MGPRDFQSARVRSREIPSHEGCIDLQRGRPQRFPDPHTALRAHLAHDGQDKRLAVIVAVRSDAEVDFFVKRVLLVAGRQRKDGVGRGERSRVPDCSAIRIPSISTQRGHGRGGSQSAECYRRASGARARGRLSGTHHRGKRKKKKERTPFVSRLVRVESQHEHYCWRLNRTTTTTTA